MATTEYEQAFHLFEAMRHVETARAHAAEMATAGAQLAQDDCEDQEGAALDLLRAFGRVQAALDNVRLELSHASDVAAVPCGGEGHTTHEDEQTGERLCGLCAAERQAKANREGSLPPVYKMVPVGEQGQPCGACGTEGRDTRRAEV